MVAGEIAQQMLGGEVDAFVEHDRAAAGHEPNNNPKPGGPQQPLPGEQPEPVSSRPLKLPADHGLDTTPGFGFGHSRRVRCAA